MLPEAGGILEQDDFIMGAMEWCAYVKRLYDMPLKEQANLSKDEFDYLTRIKDAAKHG